MSWPWDSLAYASGPAMLESALSFFSQAGGHSWGLRLPATVGQKQGIRGDLYRWPARIEALLILSAEAESKNPCASCSCV